MKNFILLLNFILLPSASVHTLAQEAYAVMSKDSTTLTFYYDNLKASREGTKFELNIGAERPDWVKVVKEKRIELAENPNFKTVVFDNSFKDARPCSCAYWFAGFENLTKIEGLENLNTSKVTDMSRMFDSCKSLTHLDLSSFNTASVTDMKGMFFYCTNLTNLDVSKFNTLNVTVMGAMFWNCRSLKSLDLTNFNTSNVTKMNGMFYRCRILTNLDISRFNTSNVTNMIIMFGECYSLASLDLSNFNTSKVTATAFMFKDCPNLKTIYVGDGWDTSKVTESMKMFEYSTQLVGGKGTKYDSDATDASRAKIDGGIDNPGYLTEKK